MKNNISTETFKSVFRALTTSQKHLKTTIACNKESKKGKFMKSISLRIFKVKFLTLNVFVFYKNLLCRLRSSWLRHNVNNGVKCK